MFIYPGNLKEKKTFMYLTISDLIITGVLVVAFTIYSAENLSFIPLVVPVTYFIFKVRILENNSNLWDQVIKTFNYLVSSQQNYFWGEGK